MSVMIVNEGDGLENMVNGLKGDILWLVFHLLRSFMLTEIVVLPRLRSCSCPGTIY